MAEHLLAVVKHKCRLPIHTIVLERPRTNIRLPSVPIHGTPNQSKGKTLQRISTETCARVGLDICLVC